MPRQNCKFCIDLTRCRLGAGSLAAYPASLALTLDAAAIAARKFTIFSL